MDLVYNLKVRFGLSLLLIIFISGCDMLQTPVLDNPNDPSSEYFKAKAPSQLTVQSFSTSTISLNWRNNSNYILKNIVKRSIDDGPYSDFSELKGTDSSFTDTTLSKEHSYAYIISAVSRNGNFSLSDQINLNYKPYADNFARQFSYVTSFVKSSDDKYIACKTLTDQIFVYNLLDEQKQFEFSGNATVMSFSKNNNYLVTGDNERKVIEVRDIISGGVIKSFDHSGSDILSLAVSPDESVMATIDNLNYLRIFDFNTGIQVHAIFQLTTYINQALIKFSPDGKYLALYSAYFRLIDLKETTTWKNEHRLLEVYNDKFFFTSDNRYMSYSVYENYSLNLHLWDMNTGFNIVSDIIKEKYYAFSTEEKFLGIYRNNILEVWSLDNYNLLDHLTTITCSAGIRNIYLTKTGKILVLDDNLLLNIWDDKGYWSSF